MGSVAWHSLSLSADPLRLLFLRLKTIFNIREKCIANFFATIRCGQEFWRLINMGDIFAKIVFKILRFSPKETCNTNTGKRDANEIFRRNGLFAWTPTPNRCLLVGNECDGIHQQSSDAGHIWPQGQKAHLFPLPPCTPPPPIPNYGVGVERCRSEGDKGVRPQSTYIYRAPQYVSPCWNWDSPTPLAASECALPRTKGGGAHSPAAKGVGESQFQRLEKRLALCLLCGLGLKYY